MRGGPAPGTSAIRRGKKDTRATGPVDVVGDGGASVEERRKLRYRARWREGKDSTQQKR